MSFDRDNPEHLLSLIESGASLAGLDPAKARRAEAMRRDRVLLASLPELSAPPGLLDDVAAALERRVLLSFTTDEPDAIATPPRTVVVRAFPWRAAFAGALAASVVFASVLGFYLLSRPSPAPAPIAQGDLLPDPAMPITHDPPVPMDIARPEETTFAHADPVDPLPEPPVAAPDYAHLAALAGEGRLILRIRTGDPSRAEGRLAQLAARTPLDPFRTLPTGLPAALASDIRHLPAYTAPLPPREHPIIVAMGTGDEARPLIFSASVPLPPVVRRLSVRSIHAMELTPTPETIESLLRLLASGDRDRVIVDRLAAPMEAPPPSFDAERVFWWTLPPSEWRRPVLVPIAVETLD